MDSKIIKDIYYIFIDESGSINQNSYGSFLVSLFIVKKSNLNKVKKYSIRNINEFKNEFKNFNKLNTNLQLHDFEEVKAHDLKMKGKEHLIFSLCDNLLEFNTSYAAWLNNKNIREKWTHDKNATYNFMIKCAIERWIDNDNPSMESELIIIADNRSIKSSFLLKVEDYLSHEFCIKNNWFKGISFKFMESHKSWEIQIADYFSFYNYCIINKKIVRKQIKKIRIIH